MSSDTQEVSKMVGIYKKLFTVLVIITALGIGIAFLHMPIWLAVTIALAIIFFKSAVVVESFKHLLVGRQVLVLTYGLTLCFLAGMVLLIWFNSNHGRITDTVDLSKEVQMQEKPAAEHKAAEGEARGH